MHSRLARRTLRAAGAITVSLLAIAAAALIATALVPRGTDSDYEHPIGL